MRNSTKADGSKVKRLRTRAKKKKHVAHDKPNLAKHGLKRL